MSKNDLQKVKAFYAKQGECPSIKWTRDANRVQRAVCTKDVERRKQRAAERKAEWENKKRWQREQEEWFSNAYREAMYERIALLYMFLNSVPSDSFQYLGLPETAEEEQIKRRYREMSLKVHPDKGGSQEEFIKLTEHKNKCLKWASKK